MLEPQKFALLTYAGTQNLGDEIQSIAAQRFLPRVDAWVDREHLDEFQAGTPHKIILNGWFLHRPEHWPPSASLHPLVTSFHLTRQMVAGANVKMIPPSATVLSGQGLQFLKLHEPIGARDLDTLGQLKAAGVAAYFSGCLTLTLRADGPALPRASVYAVDVPDHVLAPLLRGCHEPIVRLSHGDSELTGAARFAKAAGLLRCYANAKAVVTTRLHCALPCLALGTPVLLIEAAGDRYRFDGLRDLLHCASPDEISSGRARFDLSGPPANKDGWQTLRDALEAQCASFIGDGNTVMLSGANPA
jgi:hypothetical protein